MMLQNAHGPVPIATFATVAFEKEIIPWLCTSIAIAHCQLPEESAKRKKELRKVTKKSSAEKEPSRSLQELFSDFSFNWFCLLFAELLRSIFQ
jgi:hypothetical protein